VSNRIEKVLVPDIGGAEAVDVIEVLVKAGDTIAQEDSLITLEGDKATMDIPSPYAGVVKTLLIQVGAKISEGAVILTMEVAGKAESSAAVDEVAESVKKEKSVVAASPVPAEKVSASPEEMNTDFGITVHAGPAVRRIAREFAVDLSKISGSGEKGRIVKEDVQQFVKSQLQIAAGKGSAGGGLSVLAAPTIDFSKFGDIETQALSKIKKISGANLHRNWVTIPHVTQFADADITELEAFRQEKKASALKQGVKLTPLLFMIKAVVAALKKFPHFNASLDATGEQLILKKYFHIGIAVDTPNGLVVPVIRHVDQKGLFDLAKELGDISKKAREKGLGLADMQGGCFSISSLGGIGGTAFAPIINAPEVAILGVSKSQMKPVYTNSEFEPRLMLPLSLSYDHRVIDGADGARFMVYLSQCLSDIRTLLL